MCCLLYTSSSASQAETSEVQTEQPTQTEIQSEPQTQETVQTSSEADSVEETQENETEYFTCLLYTSRDNYGRSNGDKLLFGMG